MLPCHGFEPPRRCRPRDWPPRAGWLEGSLGSRSPLGLPLPVEDPPGLTVLRRRRKKKLSGVPVSSSDLPTHLQALNFAAVEQHRCLTRIWPPVRVQGAAGAGSGSRGWGILWVPRGSGGGTTLLQGGVGGCGALQGISPPRTRLGAPCKGLVRTEAKPAASRCRWCKEIKVGFITQL